MRRMSLHTRPLSTLTIAGSDSGGGAGIQADLKTFAAHRVHGLTAIAALTAQHTRGVSEVHVPPADFLRAQLDACFDDFRVGAVKIGMLANAAVVRTVAEVLADHPKVPVVLDPVMVAVASIPSFTARMSKSSKHASTCARRNARSGTCTAVTPRVCCAVSAAIAERPCTPCAAKVLRSAWMPAPPR